MAIPCALIFPSDYSLGSLIRVRCVECFLEERRPICAKSARVGCTYNVLQVCGSRATGSLDRDLKTCDDHGEVKATPSACAAGCDLLVICSLNGNPARVGCKSESAKRSLLESGGHVPLPMGDRAATPCDRSLGCEAAPSTYAAGMLCSLRGESAWLECTPAELSAYCLDPMACALQVLLFFFPPRFATQRLACTNPPPCGMSLPCGGACYQCPIYCGGWLLQCAVERLAPAECKTESAKRSLLEPCAAGLELPTDGGPCGHALRSIIGL